MTQLQEKRKHIRHPCDGQIILRYTQRDSSQIEADLTNFSEQGLSFFTYRPLKPGTTVMFRASMENYRHPSPEADCLLRSMGLVTIKWCRSDTHQGKPIHHMGAAYVMPF